MHDKSDETPIDKARKPETRPRPRLWLVSGGEPQPEPTRPAKPVGRHPQVRLNNDDDDPGPSAA
jgi:hypothetical protein